MLPEDLMAAVNPVAYMEFHRTGVMTALKQISDRAMQSAHQASISEAEARGRAEHEKLLQLKEKPQGIQAELEQLRRELADLLLAVDAKKQEIQAKEATLTAATEAIAHQEEAVRSALAQARTRYEAFVHTTVPGSDEEDHNYLAEMEAIRRRAIEAIRLYL